MPWPRASCILYPPAWLKRKLRACVNRLYFPHIATLRVITRPLSRKIHESGDLLYAGWLRAPPSVEEVSEFLRSLKENLHISGLPILVPDLPDTMRARNLGKGDKGEHRGVRGVL